MTRESEQRGLLRRRAATRKWFDDSELAQDAPEYDPNIIEAICDKMVNDGVSLARICRDQLIEGAPSLARLHYLRQSDERIDAAIMSARQAQVEAKWADLGERIEEELSAAGELADKVQMMAVSAKLKMQLDHLKFEVRALIPALYGDPRDKLIAATKPAGRLRKVGGESAGPARVLEVPSKLPAPKLEPAPENMQSADVVKLAALPNKR